MISSFDEYGFTYDIALRIRRELWEYTQSTQSMAQSSFIQREKKRNNSLIN